MRQAGAFFPLGFVRKNYEVNVLLPRQLTQEFSRRSVDIKKGKVMLSSSMSDLFRRPTR
ncbi:hypothetical protein [Bradyrhizobium sp. NAS80.1]|uniref:hypothetical protein n=1 Tax=Bradyrhizobium sp. NAS80.1 TaxID=1680159 RepID=UPI00143D2C02|nr:hypothetical protein [Bradyrhizobium sp. NAS80.1]